MQEVCTAMHFAKCFMKSGTAKTVAAVVVPTALTLYPTCKLFMHAYDVFCNLVYIVIFIL